MRPVTDAFVLEAELALREGVDPGAVGAAVTVELCGHWEHEGPCRWPHNSAIETQRDPARFRTLFVADEREATLVCGRIETACATTADGASYACARVPSRRESVTSPSAS
jgi:hypothetical protein